MKKKISILGSTGSIGRQTLDIVSNNNDLQVTALAAGSNIDKLEEQIRKYKPDIACVYDADKAYDLEIKVKDTNTKIVSGMDGLIETACYCESDIVVTALVGMIGIRPTIEAIKSGKDIALANKETLVTAGHIIIPLAKEKNVKILPVDSEHSAIFQSLNGESHDSISKIILTASGGPFRGKTKDEMKDVKLEDALKHPNWSMGRKITIDSATMVNKGLEVIEAKWLFDIELDKIEVIIHPESIIHSMVEFRDGAIMAQLGAPDMRVPIQYAIYYPERRNMNTECVNFAKLGKISFESPDLQNFTGLKLAYHAARVGGSLPTVFNAANEYAVNKFLNGKIQFLEIADTIEYTMEKHLVAKNPSVEEILAIEAETYKMIESR